MTESVVNDYGNIDPYSDLGRAISKAMGEACDSLLPLLDKVELRELRVVTGYIEGYVAGDLADYILERQMNKMKGQMKPKKTEAGYVQQKS